MTLRVNSEQNQLRIEVSDKRLTLKPGQWSDWLKVSFRVTPVDKVKGVCRFYLKSLTPLQLYCSPLNFDPRSPLAAISYPQDLTAQLAKRIGLFYTQGMPYETSALNQGFINKDAFLTQARSILGKRQQILKLKLAEFNHGLFFFYFEYPDTIQHFFWQDKDNPDSNYQEIVTDCYQKMDKIIGWVMDNIDKNTTLLVLSDHGFSSFKYSAHLNTWLKNKGWLKLKQNQDTGNFSDIDWTKTKAYALGFGGIYLNIKGIRKQGAVNPGAEAKKLRQKIKQALVNWQNPQTKGTVISQVYNKEEVFKGKYSEQAPDLFIGFNHGYRASWQTALGKVTPQQLTANTRPWNGSHIIDPKLVPGVLFSNQKLSNEKKAKITDLAPTILDILKVEINQDFDGESLL
jgi:predicted AlkP superfamily phosphohydrolase/phosphomutase